MCEEKQYHEIDDSIKIDFPVPSDLQELFEQAEEADLSNDFGNYIMIADTIDTVAKNVCAAGGISSMQWDIICRRYKQW